MIVFANTITPRLQYISDFVGTEITGRPFILTSNSTDFINYPGEKINYSETRLTDSEFMMPNSRLLFETGIREQVIECFTVNNHPAFFRTRGDFSFDLFAASFYLLSRYEEYLNHQKDRYGRYGHKNSLAFKEKFLHLPLVNIWLQHFRVALGAKFPGLGLHQSSFNFIPTYDIDEAYAYKDKQWWRTLGGFARSMANGQWWMIGERMKVLLGKKRDPYDAFEWMDELNKEYRLKPVYFFLVAGRTGKYDKNTLPGKKSMQGLIQQHADRYSIAIHPSWQSGDDVEKLKCEFLRLGHISGRAVRCSRQHYIRFTLPQTYRQLINLGIEADYSMGYGSVNGFRASTATPFYWYDLERETRTSLLVYPFCFMDANSFYEQKSSASEALEEMNRYLTAVRAVHGTLITIWHNNFLGESRSFPGWRDTFERFVKLISRNEA